MLLVEHGKRCARCAKNGKPRKESHGDCPLVNLQGSAAVKDLEDGDIVKEEPKDMKQDGIVEDGSKGVKKEDVVQKETKVKTEDS